MPHAATEDSTPIALSGDARARRAFVACQSQTHVDRTGHMAAVNPGQFTTGTAGATSRGQA